MSKTIKDDNIDIIKIRSKKGINKFTLTDLDIESPFASSDAELDDYGDEDDYRLESYNDKEDLDLSRRIAALKSQLGRDSDTGDAYDA